MRSFITRAVAAGASVAALTAAQQATFRSSADAVAVYAVVTDRSGRFVPDLTRDDFRVLDNGRDTPLTLFSNAPQPATVTLLLDMSESTVAKVVRIRDAAVAFAHALAPGDRVRVGSFGAEIAISPVVTADRAVLERVLHEELWPGGGTPLWNAIDAGIDSLRGEAGRRVVLALTDGRSNTSLPGFDGTLASVERRAVDQDVMVYGIGMEGNELESAVVRLAETTGGAHFNLRRAEDLQQVFAGVADELRHQYLLGFVPRDAAARPHTLDVRVTRPGLKVRARRSYVQRTPDAASSGPAPLAAPPAVSESTAPPTAIVIDATQANAFVPDLQAWLRAHPVLDDTVSVGLMTRTLHWSPWSRDGRALADWLDRSGAATQPSSYGPSPIWDAADAALAPLSSAHGARVVLLTDGRATGNRTSAADLIRHASRSRVAIDIGYRNTGSFFNLPGRAMLLIHPEYQLQAVAELTNGRFAKVGDDLLPVIERTKPGR